MSRITLKNEKEFEDEIKKLESVRDNIKTLLDSQDSEMQKINETSVWTSDCQKELIKKYASLSSSYEDIYNSLNNYINFMYSALNRYRGINQERSYSASYNSNELDVNTVPSEEVNT